MEKKPKPLETHPRRPRGSQSGREKRRDESFQVVENFRPAFSPDPTECPWVSEDVGNLIFDQVLPVLHPHTFSRCSDIPFTGWEPKKRTLQLLKYLCMYYLYNLTHKTILLQGMYRIHVDVTTLCQDLFIELMVRACYHFYRFCHFNIICF